MLLRAARGEWFWHAPSIVIVTPERIKRVRFTLMVTAVIPIQPWRSERVNIDPNGTGPWTLPGLERVLGTARNLGVSERVALMGGDSIVAPGVGPYQFGCGCIARTLGIGGSLILTPCSPAHRALRPA
jgi:hypothetical protein